MNIRLRPLALAAGLILALATSYAQSISGELTGTVFDASGAVLPGATVTATNTATGVFTSATAGESGVYHVTNLLVGTYNLAAIAPGFAGTEVRGIAVDLNKTVTANLTLQVARASASVNVTEAPALLDTTSAQIENTYRSRQLANLPEASSGSGLLNLALLSPGVTTGGSVGVGTGPSVGGQRPRNNNFTIEGVDNNSVYSTGPLVIVPNDAVTEFTILQNQFSPEFGHSSGGQFNQAIKSGTNEFHGLLYEYTQNRNFRAADQQAVVSGTPLHPRYDWNRLGANFGGPIKRNKLFFFLNFEYNPLGLQVTPGTLYGPTAAGYDALATVPAISATNLSVLRRYLGAAATASDPSTLPNGPTQVGGLSIPVGLLPVSASAPQNSYFGVASVDYNISNTDSLRGRFVYNRTDAIDSAAALPVFWTSQPNRYYLAQATEYHNFSSSLTNELRLAYNRANHSYLAGSQVFPGLSVFPNLAVLELNLDLGPDPSAPQRSAQNVYQFTDNLAWIRGAHTIKFGYDFRKIIAPSSYTQRSRGDYEWTTLQNYLFDTVPDYFFERSVGNVTYYADQIQNGAFVNDDWKLRPNLTINLGLRYEYQTVPFSQRLQSVNNFASVPGLISFHEPNTQTTNFMPRVGFAYSPGSAGNTSIRGGFGINYDQLFNNLGVLSLPPQFQTTVDGTPLTSGFLANGAIPDRASAGAITDPATARSLTTSFIPDQKLPKSIQWNLGVQHVFAKDYTVEVRYTGTRGINLPVQVRLNSFSPVQPGNSLPVYTVSPGQQTLDALPLTLSQLQAAANPAAPGVLPAYAGAGFTSFITGFMPVGNSTYHGLATQLTRRFTNGLQLSANYTWSHAIDDSTAEVFSTVLTPRRPQDSQNLRAERSNSALDHRQRATLAVLYDTQWFKGSQNWFLKNLVGNWELAPVYTYQTGSWATPQSGDVNLNRDSAGDRTVINPAGLDNVGTGVTPLTNSAGQTVAYLANNANARYIQAGRGVYPNAARNTYQLPPINNFDLTLAKRFAITERLRLELQAQASNVFNHAQFIGGFTNDIAPAVGVNTAQVLNLLHPSSTTFNRPDLVFSNNPRVLTVVAKFTF